MSLEANKTVCDRLAEAISGGDIEALEALTTPEVAAAHRAGLAEVFTAFPDLRGASLEQIAEGDTVVCRWLFLGTHLGAYRGIVGTGKTITFRGVSIARIADGRVVSLHCLADGLDVMRQLTSEMPQEMLESLHTSIWFSLRGQGKNLN